MANLLQSKLTTSGIAMPDLYIVRVAEGGHDIPQDVILRRYDRGLKNFFHLYQDSVDHWIFVDNSGAGYELVAQKTKEKLTITNFDLWNLINQDYGQI